MTEPRIDLPLSEMPRQWYNLAADLPKPPPPPLGPDGNPIGPDALALYHLIKCMIVKDGFRLMDKQ